MTLDEAVDHFGSGWAMCAALDLRTQNFTKWKKNNRIPTLQQLRIQEFTGGVLRADLQHFHRSNRKD